MTHPANNLTMSADPITVRQNKSKGQIWSHVRAKWLVEILQEIGV